VDGVIGGGESGNGGDSGGGSGGDKGVSCGNFDEEGDGIVMKVEEVMKI